MVKQTVSFPIKWIVMQVFALIIFLLQIDPRSCAGAAFVGHDFLRPIIPHTLSTINNGAFKNDYIYESTALNYGNDKEIHDEKFIQNKKLAKVDQSILENKKQKEAKQTNMMFENNKEKPSLASLVTSINYFISRECNYSCKFCFHTQKNVHKLSLEEAKLGIKMLRECGTEKINFAGGEPFMNDILLGELCRYSHELGMAVSIISNGSLIKPYWMKLYGPFVDVLGLSVDSFNPAVNAAIGRGGDANNKHLEQVLRVRELCHEHSIIFKLNTVVCSLNWQEDMSDSIRKLEPQRWKCFQVLILNGENSGGPGELRNANDLVISKDQFESFVKRHAEFDVLVPEPNNLMRDSYLLLDEELRFLDCSNGGKVPSQSILTVGVEEALQQAGFDYDAFITRGGIYDWTRER